MTQQTLMPERLVANAKATPNAIALVTEEGQVTYAELVERAGGVARALQERGVRRGDRVGVCLDRSFELYAALYGAFFVGASYVPLEPSYPEERLAAMVQDGRVELVLTDEPRRELVVRLGAKETLLVGDVEPASFTPIALSEHDLAYTIFTSGSTGRPKGVMIEHGGLACFLDAVVDKPGVTATDTFLAFTVISFDMSVFELFVAHAVGARVALAGPRDGRDGSALRRLMERFDVTLLAGTPATWRLVVDSGVSLAQRRGWIGGDSVPRDIVDRLAVELDALWNLYGPTETTVCVMGGPLLTTAPVTIGWALPGTEILLLDEALAPTDEGEIYVAGPQVGRGYALRPDLTAEKYLPHPTEPGARMYRTGDLARRHADGRIEHLGRTDHQVKIRGFRIEMGEIEAALLRSRGVVAAQVLAREDIPGRKVLVAYLIGERRWGEELRYELTRHLPNYMIPSSFVWLDAFPLSSAGKIDRKALPPPLTLDRTSAPRPPSDALEAELLALWSDLLGTDALGVDDALFTDWGADSLVAARAAAWLAKRGHIIVIEEIFGSRTIAALAERIRGGSSGPALVALESRGEKTPIVFFHAVLGDGFVFLPLARSLANERPVWVLHGSSTDPSHLPPTLVDLAKRYADEICARIEGPLVLSGYSTGAIIAFECAHELVRRGRVVERLVYFEPDSPKSKYETKTNWRETIGMRLAYNLPASLRGVLPWYRPPSTDQRERFRALCVASLERPYWPAIDVLFPGLYDRATIEALPASDAWDAVFSALDPTAFAEEGRLLRGREYRRRVVFARELRLRSASYVPTGAIDLDVFVLRRPAWTAPLMWRPYIKGQIREEVFQSTWVRPNVSRDPEIAAHVSILDAPNLSAYLPQLRAELARASRG